MRKYTKKTKLKYLSATRSHLFKFLYDKYGITDSSDCELIIRDLYVGVNNILPAIVSPVSTTTIPIQTTGSKTKLDFEEIKKKLCARGICPCYGYCETRSYL